MLILNASDVILFIASIFIKLLIGEGTKSHIMMKIKNIIMMKIKNIVMMPIIITNIIMMKIKNNIIMIIIMTITKIS